VNGKKDIMKVWDKLVDRIKSGIDLDINKLAKKDKTFLRLMPY
jgi:hypothetical protein